MIREGLMDGSELVAEEWVIDRSGFSIRLEYLNLGSLKNFREIGLFRRFSSFGPIPVPIKRVLLLRKRSSIDFDVTLTANEGGLPRPSTRARREVVPPSCLRLPWPPSIKLAGGD